MKRIVSFLLGFILVFIISACEYIVPGGNSNGGNNSGENGGGASENIPGGGNSDSPDNEGGNLPDNPSEENSPSQYNLSVKVGNYNFTATLYNNQTVKAIIKKLPITLNMSDLNQNEKYIYFNENLPTNSSRLSKINNGDILLYGTNCFVIFYETFNTSYSYTSLGKIDNPANLSTALGRGNVSVQLALINS